MTFADGRKMQRGPACGNGRTVMRRYQRGSSTPFRCSWPRRSRSLCSRGRRATQPNRTRPRPSRAPPTASLICLASGSRGAAAPDWRRRSGGDRARPTRPPDARSPPPRTTAVQARGRGQAAGLSVARRGIDDPMARCLISGVPRITTRPLPFEIVQMKGRSSSSTKRTMRSALFRPTAGRIRTTSNLRISAIRSDAGRANTLVVDVIGFNDQDLARRRRHDPQRETARDERYTRDSRRHHPLRCHDRGSGGVHEAVACSRKSSGSAPNERLREYECIENNEDLLRFEKLLEIDPALRK